MSPRRCIIEGCPSVSTLEEHQQVTFHQVPSNSSTRTKWIENCKIPKSKTITKSVLVCSRHFRLSDFVKKNDKFLLRQGVVPSMFPWGTTAVESDSAASGVNSEESADSSEQQTTTEVLSSIKPDKLTALKQRSISADANLSATTAVAAAVDSKNEPRKSLDSSMGRKKRTSFSQSSDNNDMSRKRRDFLSKLEPGHKVEAQDFNNVWHHAKIMEVDHGEKEVFVHFEKNPKSKGPM